MRVIFFGTPIFAAHVLEYLLEHYIQVVAVISKPDRPKGRSGAPVPTPVKQVVLDRYPLIPVYQPEMVSAPDFADTLKSFNADLFVVVAYGEIIKQHLLDMPPLGCINLHASLLPKYRGAAPIQRCIINGEEETGVTIMHMVKKMDAGDIIEMAKVPIGHDTTFGQLEEILCNVGKKLLLNVIQDFEKGIVKRIPQDHSQATFAPKIELEDCEINWQLPALTLHNLIRGTNPYPGAWCYIKMRNERKRLKIVRSEVVEQSGEPGAILDYTKGHFIVAAGHQALCLLDVQLEGKKTMTADEFMRGIPLSSLSFQVSL